MPCGGSTPRGIHPVSDRARPGRPLIQILVNRGAEQAAREREKIMSPERLEVHGNMEAGKFTCEVAVQIRDPRDDSDPRARLRLAGIQTVEKSQPTHLRHAVVEQDRVWSARVRFA